MIWAQIAIPMVAVVWLLVWPQRNALAFGFQALAVLLLVLGAACAAIWTAIPQWTMAILATIWIIACLRGYRRIDPKQRMPTPLGWMATFVSLLLAGLGLWLLVEALAGRRPPPGPAIDLAMPLDGDDLMVANGGSRLLINAHQDVLDPSVPRHRLWTGQAYGIDLVAVNRVGVTSDGLKPADPRRYAIFGRPVRAPCSGTIAATLDGRPDLEVPDVDPEVMQGNFVLLRCGTNEVVLAHLQLGSVAVRAGQAVERGDVIGKVGNSGYSDEPHLHINAQTPGTDRAPFSGDPIAMRFNGRFLARNDRP